MSHTLYRNLQELDHVTHTVLQFARTRSCHTHCTAICKNQIMSHTLYCNLQELDHVTCTVLQFARTRSCHTHMYCNLQEVDHVTYTALQFTRTRSCHIDCTAIFNNFLNYLTFRNQLLLMTSNFIFRLVSLPFLIHVTEIRATAFSSSEF